MMQRILLAILVSVGLSACGVSKDKYTAIEGQLNGCAQQLDAANADKKTCEDRLASLSNQTEQLMDKTKTYEDLVNSLQDEIKSGKVKISEMENRLTVNLIDKILFDSGSTQIKDEGKVALQKIAQVLSKVKDKRIQVEGHTDNVRLGPSLRAEFPTNWELSTARATSVVRFLAQMKVDQNKLSATGYSMFAPVSANDSNQGRRQNRRIEIVLVPDHMKVMTGMAKSLQPSTPKAEVPNADKSSKAPSPAPAVEADTQEADSQDVDPQETDSEDE